MEVLLNRVAKKESYTIGKMYIDGKYVCDTLEDKDRGLSDTMPLNVIKNTKIPKITAIPTGRYKIDMNTVSPKYSKSDFYKKICDGKVPRLMNVKGYEGVLIHVGNKDSDTEGCILVGQNKVVGQVINSKVTFESVYKILSSATDDIYLTIV